MTRKETTDFMGGQASEKADTEKVHDGTFVLHAAEREVEERSR